MVIVKAGAERPRGFACRDLLLGEQAGEVHRGC